MCVLSPGRYKTEIQQSTSSDIDGTRVGLVWRASRGYISGRGITSAAQSSLQPSLGVALEIWPPGGANCISYKFGQQVAPLALVRNLANMWLNFQQMHVVPSVN